MDYNIFEQLCAELLKVANPRLRIESPYRFSRSISKMTDPLGFQEADIVGFMDDAVDLVAEVKAYRSLAVPTNWLILSARKLESAAFAIGIPRAV